jgi:hypothetical protein
LYSSLGGGGCHVEEGGVHPIVVTAYEYASGTLVYVLFEAGMDEYPLLTFSHL